VRFVLDPEGRVTPDIKRKLPGRGVWITGTYEAVANSVRRKVFARSFRQAVAVADDLPDIVSDLLRRAALQDLAFANKASLVVAGFAKVEKALGAGKTIALLHASDASRDGCRKLDRRAQALLERATGTYGPIMCFTSAELSGALGKENVIHAAIADGGAGRKFLWSAARFMNYMVTSPAAASAADTSEQDYE
jgi:predicted RNA-binding protein YlxR (DUF448 family)